MTSDIHPSIGAMLNNARDWLTHEHSLFQSLNLEPALLGRGKATFVMDLPEAFTDEHDVIHGGLMTIIIDSIFGLTVFTALEELKPIATINLRIDYIANAKAGARAVCAAHCIAVNDDVAYVSGDLKIEDSGRLLATAAGAFMVGTRGPAKGSRL